MSVFLCLQRDSKVSPLKLKKICYSCPKRVVTGSISGKKQPTECHLSVFGLKHELDNLYSSYKTAISSCIDKHEPSLLVELLTKGFIQLCIF